MNRYYLKKNRLSLSIFIFLIVFMIINLLKPGIFYDKYGAIREFGLNQTNKTIVPIWLITISIAILSYLIIMYFIYF
jgi:hypothetical protein